VAEQITWQQLFAYAEQSQQLADQLGQVAAGLRQYGTAATDAVGAVDTGMNTLVREWGSLLTDTMATRVKGDFRQTTDMATDTGIAASALEDTQQKLAAFSTWVTGVVGSDAPDDAALRMAQSQLDDLATAVVSNATTLNGTFQRPWLGSKGTTPPPPAPAPAPVPVTGPKLPARTRLPGAAPVALPPGAGPAATAGKTPAGLARPTADESAAAGQVGSGASDARVALPDNGGLGGAAPGGLDPAVANGAGDGAITLPSGGLAGAPSATLDAPGRAVSAIDPATGRPITLPTLSNGALAEEALPGVAGLGSVGLPSGVRPGAIGDGAEFPLRTGGISAADAKLPKITLPGELGGVGGVGGVGGGVGGGGRGGGLTAENGAAPGTLRLPGGSAAGAAEGGALGGTRLPGGGISGGGIAGGGAGSVDGVPGSGAAGRLGATAAEGALPRGAAAGLAEAGAAGRGGTPPYFPPMGGMGGAGGRGGAAIRPGVAERAGGPELGGLGTPTAPTEDAGVPPPLRGRRDSSGRSGRDRPVRRARKPPASATAANDPNEVLDEHLWRVEPSSLAPGHP
jgi:hypothetical protein